MIILYFSIIPLSPHWGKKLPGGFQSRLYVRLSLCQYVCLSVSLSVRLRRFLKSKRMARNYAQLMRTQATCLNPLSGSIICSSICPSVRPRAFCGFLLVLISSVRVQRCNAFIPTLGYGGPHWRTVKNIYMCLFLYLYLLSTSLFGGQSTRSIIAGSACGCSSQGKIP